MSISRRDFTKLAAAAPLALAGLGSAAAAQAPAANNWAQRIGLELYTVRDQIARDQVATLTAVAAIGYKEVEPSVTIDHLPAKQYRALLDRLGLTAPTTHMSVTPGPDLERQLEDRQIIGNKFTQVNTPAEKGAPSPDKTKRTVDVYNQAGAVAAKYGIQVLVHNHATEFQRYAGSEQCPYDVILAESDPKLVVMELDIGWASVAGQDILALFHAHPGRFVIWHVKNFQNIQYLFPQPEMTERERMTVAGHWMDPVGLGGINYRPFFDQAELAGMKHFNIEQDNAAAWGNSIAAAGVSYKNLLRQLA